MKRLLSVFILFCACSVTCLAQNDTIMNGAGTAKDDWFVGLGTGTNILFNPGIKDVYARNGAGVTVSLSVGKWIMPYFGMRVELGGLMWHGAANADNISAWGYDVTYLHPHSDMSCDYNIFYVNPHVDVMLSLYNCAHKGYKSPQKWDIIPFAGIGYSHAFDHKGFVGGDFLTGHFGFIGKYCINENWDINLELETTLMPDYYTVPAGPVVREDLSVALGFTYNIGGHTFSYKPRSTKGKQPESSGRDTVIMVQTIQQVIERGAPVSNGELQAAAQQGTFDQAFQIALIEFNLGNDEPKQNYETQYYNVASFVHAYPKVTLRLDSYCDKDTGTEDSNIRLAQRRAECVKNILVNKYGVPSDIITLNAIGSREQVYTEGALNRIVRVTVVPE